MDVFGKNIDVVYSALLYMYAVHGPRSFAGFFTRFPKRHGDENRIFFVAPVISRDVRATDIHTHTRARTIILRCRRPLPTLAHFIVVIIYRV